MVWKYASNKFKKNYSTFYHGSIIGDWLEPFVFTVSSKSLPSYRRVDLFVELPTVICPGSRSILDLSLLHRSFHLPLSFPLGTTLAHFHPFPFFFPLARSRTGSLGLSSLIYILDVGIDQPPLYHDKTCTPRFIAVLHYGDTSARGFAGINCHSNRRQSSMTVVADDAEKLKGLLGFSYIW